MQYREPSLGAGTAYLTVVAVERSGAREYAVQSVAEMYADWGGS